jgi:type II secretory ATPase GspE/PulE/Tfp pilus assembly ATPase PilB-like protein
LQELLNEGQDGPNHSLPHIVTIEDPIEYRLNQVSQTEVNPQVDFNYKQALRSVLRQDPDVIMMGEIRDSETAHAAIQAGLTGHLVISTIHSGTAAGVFTRLLDMGLEAFLISSAISGVLAQRLVRRNCSACNAAYEPEKALVRSFSIDEEFTFMRGTGCKACEGLGYVGRTAIGEMLAMNEELSELILERRTTAVLQEAAKRNHMSPMVEHGLKKVKRGRTTLEELHRVLPPQDKE